MYVAHCGAARRTHCVLRAMTALLESVQHANATVRCSAGEQSAVQAAEAACFLSSSYRACQTRGRSRYCLPLQLAHRVHSSRRVAL
jgi:hypothetical protein